MTHNTKKIQSLLPAVSKNSKGFTLIEVVLVLAIGGLIFLLAFLAFQQVSRNRRDTQRRSDVARMASTFNDLKGDIGGTTNPTFTQWKAAIASTPGMTTPTGGAYDFGTASAYSASKPTALDGDKVTLVRVVVSGQPDDYSVCVGLEGTGRVPACRPVY